MKKILLSILLFLMFYGCAFGQTAVTSMTEDTSPTSDDIIYVINNPGVTPGDRKVTLGNAITKAHGLTGDGYLLKLNGTTIASTSSITGITLGGFTASKGLCSDGSGNAVACTNLTDTVTGTGSVVLATTPTLVTPILGAATATSLLATGIVDGTAPIVITATSAGYTLGATYKSGYTFTNPVAAAATFNFTLPTAAAGLQYCVGNGATKTGILKVMSSAAGQYIDLDGTLSASGGFVSATAVAGNFGCFVGIDATNWKAIPTKGVWSRD